MTREMAIVNFKERLDQQYADEFDSGILLTKGRTLKWTNLNSTFNIEILSFDGIKVTFKLLDIKDNNIYEFTLDNFYIHNSEYVNELFDKNTRKYDKLDVESFRTKEMDCKGIYILSDENDKILYIGQAEHIGWRMLDHIHTSSNQKIDNVLRENNNIKMRIIRLEETSYRNLDALECAFINHFNTYHDGMNETRGNNGPGSQQITRSLI